MGDVIRRDAAASDIITDARTSLTRAQAKKGAWQSIAEEKLGPGVAAMNVIDAQLAQLNQEAAPLLAAIPVMDDVSDALIGKISDDAWNLLGRPANDPFYDLLFPGGISVYTDGLDEEQPARIELLASLLETGVHPRLDPAFATQAAKDLRSNAASYQAALEAARPSRLQIQLYNKTKLVLARGLQLALSSLKRRLKSELFTEADIHTVIPDRPRNVAPAATAEITTPPTPASNESPK